MQFNWIQFICSSIQKTVRWFHLLSSFTLLNDTKVYLIMSTDKSRLKNIFINQLQITFISVASFQNKKNKKDDNYCTVIWIPLNLDSSYLSIYYKLYQVPGVARGKKNSFWKKINFEKKCQNFLKPSTHGLIPSKHFSPFGPWPFGQL